MGFWQPKPNLSWAPFPPAFVCCFQLQCALAKWYCVLIMWGLCHETTTFSQWEATDGGTWVTMIRNTVLMEVCSQKHWTWKWRTKAVGKRSSNWHLVRCVVYSITRYCSMVLYHSNLWYSMTLCYQKLQFLHYLTWYSNTVPSNCALHTMLVLYHRR